MRWTMHGKSRTAARHRKVDCVAFQSLAFGWPHRARPRYLPLVLLADHVEGETPILVNRVANLPKALPELKRRGWLEESTFEIPQGF